MSDASNLHSERQRFARRLAGVRWQDVGLVFTTRVGTPLNQHKVLTAFKDVLAVAKLVDRLFHDLRGSVATLLLMQGVDLLTISSATQAQHQRHNRRHLRARFARIATRGGEQNERQIDWNGVVIKRWWLSQWLSKRKTSARIEGGHFISVNYSKERDGTRGGARTHGLLLRRQTLYPLSYPRITAMVVVSAAGVKATITMAATDRSFTM